MNTTVEISNFRIIDNKGAQVDFCPITILTGCNNSGKSSIVKAMCLLKDFCDQIEQDYKLTKTIHLEKYKLDFHKSPNNQMGTFDVVRFNKKKVYNTKLRKDISGEIEHANNDSINNIGYEIVVESSWLMQDVILHLEFGALDSDDLNDGYLMEYSIRTLDDIYIFKAKRGESAFKDYTSVKKSLLHFIYGQYAVSQWQQEFERRNALGEEPIGVDPEADALNEACKTIIKNLGSAAFCRMLEWQTSNGSYMWKEGHVGYARPIMEKNLYGAFDMNRPTLGVYFYYPCLWELKDIDKSNIRQEVSKYIASSKEQLPSFKLKLVNLFLDSFEASDSLTMHDFISQKENEQFFKKEIHNFGKQGLISNNHCVWDYWFTEPFFDDSHVPDEANWQVIIVAMDIINQLMHDGSKNLVYYNEYDGRYCHETENNVDKYLDAVINDIFVHILPGSLSYYSTTVIEPRRLYSLEDNNDFSKTLKKYFEVKKEWIEKKDYGLYSKSKSNEIKYKPCSFINKWLNRLGIAHHVDIKSKDDGYATVALCMDRTGRNSLMLADKGLGVSQLFAVLLKIENAILEMETNEVLYQRFNTGLNEEVISCLRSYNQLNPITVALEEPECHLHPSLQSVFADIIVEAYKKHGVNFVIETHSEYFIRKLQLLVSDKAIGNNHVSLIYVNSGTRPEYQSVITDIGIDSEGLLKNEFGAGFFDESIRLSRDLFNKKK